ncbi:MAG: tetratricopeptide repeat protein [Dictyoglomaceae bacterium]|nr:tetratricopeptide repeat protein [Dictyoglomaceae bacterium]
MSKKKIQKEMEIKRDHYFRLVIFSCLFLAIILIPITYYLRAHDISELPKVTLLRILIGFSIILWGIWILFREKNITLPSKNISIFVLLFLISWIISTLLSTNFYLSFFGSYMRQLGFFTYSVFFIIFFLLHDIINTEKELKYFYWGIIVIAFIVGIIGLQQFFRLSSWFERVRTESRIISTLGHADFLGHYLVMVIPIVLGFLFQVKSIYLKTFFFIEFIILFLTLLASYTRGSWLAFLFTFPLFFIINYWKNKKLKLKAILINKGLTTILLIGIIGTVILFGYFERKLYPPNTSLGTFNLRERFITIGHGLGLTQANPRGLTWRDSRNLFKDKILFSERLIWGLGPETFSFNFTPYKSLDLARYDRGKGYPDREHNEFLDILFPQGILGLFSFLGVILITSLSFLKNLSNFSDENKFLIIGTFTGFLAFLVQALVLFGLTATYLYFWSIISFLFLWIRLTNNKDKIEINIRKIPKILKISIPVFCLIIGLFYIIISLNFFKAEIFYRYGLDYLNRNDPGKAVSILEEAIRLRPQESAFHEAIIKGYLQLVGGVEKEEDKVIYFKKGEEHIKGLLANAYYRSLTYNLIGAFYAQSYHYLGRKDKDLIKKAEENLLKALTFDKYAVPPLENLLRLYSTDLKDDKKAEEIAKRIVNIDPYHYDANMVLASLYYNNKKYYDAKVIYENLSKIYTNNVDVWNNLGITYFQLKEYDNAERAFLKVLEIDPNYQLTRKNLEVLSKKLGRKISLPPIPEKKDLEYYLNKGVEAYNNKDYKMAEELFKKAISINNKSSEGYNNLGAVLFVQGKYEEAIDMFKKALEINKQYLQAYGNISIALLKLGRKEEAKKYLEEGLKYFPDNQDLKKLLEDIK